MSRHRNNDNVGIKKLGDLFEKYQKNLIAPERSVVNAFIEVVNDLLGMTVKPSVIKYNTTTKTISITGSAVLRSEVKINEKEILLHLKGRLGPKSTPHHIL